MSTKTFEYYRSRANYGQIDDHSPISTPKLACTLKTITEFVILYLRTATVLVLQHGKQMKTMIMVNKRKDKEFGDWEIGDPADTAETNKKWKRCRLYFLGTK